MHKTQVFLFHEGDHYRTRLTHSLEVAQVARTIARQLRLDEDLAEAIALAHDLGHTPFGHAGERALNAAMAQYGGFDHNAQSLRIVLALERKYVAFDGLNLTWETLEGLAKHNGPVRGGAVGEVIASLASWRSFEHEHWPSGEAQVAALADDIAYLTHDVDDGLRARLLSLQELAEVPLAGPFVHEVAPAACGRLDGRHIFEVTRRMITVMIADVVEESRRRLAALVPQSADDIRRAGQPTVAASLATSRDLAALRTFLYGHVYRHDRVMRAMRGAEQIAHDLFARYRDRSAPPALPAAWQETFDKLDERRGARLVADYIAGQTDRYAIAEHRRLFDATPDLR